ncbi:hypothetical protein HDR63_02475 [bacterium]|nr:hypothetical protein [bacterium]
MHYNGRNIEMGDGMDQQTQIEKLAAFLRLTPYQTYILEKKAPLYNLGRVVKRGGILYVPYRTPSAARWRDAAARLLFGPMADLIGPDEMVATGVRGARLLPDGRVFMPRGR